MSNISVDFSIINQKGSPAWYQDTFANRPAFGFTGRMFVATDTFSLYRDTGSAWDLIGGPGTGSITGSGTSGQVSFFSGASTLAGNNNLFWDNTNARLGIGTTTPGVILDVHTSLGGNIQFNTTTADNIYLAFQSIGVAKWRIGIAYAAGANDFVLINATSSTTSLQINSTNNFSIGGGTSAAINRNLYVVKTITGNATSYAIDIDGRIQSDVTTRASYFSSLASTLAATFTLTNLTHYLTIQGSFGAGSTITNQNGFYADSTLIGATNNYGFYGNIPSGTNRFNLYMVGTAGNFLQGELTLGSGQTVSTSTTNTNTHKVKLIINGVTYYLLASTSSV